MIHDSAFRSHKEPQLKEFKHIGNQIHVTYVCYPNYGYQTRVYKEIYEAQNGTIEKVDTVNGVYIEPKNIPEQYIFDEDIFFDSKELEDISERIKKSKAGNNLTSQELLNRLRSKDLIDEETYNKYKDK